VRLFFYLIAAGKNDAFWRIVPRVGDKGETNIHNTHGIFDQFPRGLLEENTTYLLAAKVNFKPDGTPDEFFVFNITDISTEPVYIRLVQTEDQD
jgi:hypothetical protein